MSKALNPSDFKGLSALMMGKLFLADKEQGACLICTPNHGRPVPGHISHRVHPLPLSKKIFRY